MLDYAFGAGGFKLGDRVEILTTGQRGILITEMIHISGCNTFQILLPNVLIDGKMKITHRDHLMLRKLEPVESMFDAEKELTDDNSFSPKGIDVNAEWIRGAVSENREFVTEIDDAVGVEEIAVHPGDKVWNKVYGKTMVVTYVCRDIFSKEIEYGSMYMVNNKEETVCSRSYALIPLGDRIDLPVAKKLGPMFEDGRDTIVTRSKFSSDIFDRH